jgi:hypothetical protein
MKIFYILLNICFPYYSVIIPIYIETNGFISTFCSAILVSSPNNSICGFISRFYILDIFSFGARIASTFPYFWIPYGFFSS